MDAHFLSLAELIDFYAQIHAVFGQNGISLPVDEKLAYRVFHRHMVGNIGLQEENSELPQRFNQPPDKPRLESEIQLSGNQAIAITLDCEEVLERHGIGVRYNECRNGLYHGLKKSVESYGVIFPDIHQAFGGRVDWGPHLPRLEPIPPRKNWWTLAPILG